MYYNNLLYVHVFMDTLSKIAVNKVINQVLGLLERDHTYV